MRKIKVKILALLLLTIIVISNILPVAYAISDELINFATKEVKIEMASNVESLNLSVSCAVVLYKLFL